MRQVPLMIVSDAPCQTTGLGRIARDLATVFCSCPEVRVATLGLAMRGCARFPWMQYGMSRYPDGSYEYGELTLPYAWDDFSRGQQGIVLTIQDLSRMLWLARPDTVADEQLSQWIRSRRDPSTPDGGFRLWGYFPIDSTGPGGKLTTMSREVLLGYDRVLAYTPFGEQQIRATIGDEEANRRGCTFMPHGFAGEIWRP